MDNEQFNFFKLGWDTEYFKIPCAKAVLYDTLTAEEWGKLVPLFADYTLIVIENKGMDPVNAQWIGRNTTAFLADVSIVLEKFLSSENSLYELPPGIEISNNVPYNEDIMASSRHTYTRLIYDPELFKRGGDKVLDQKLFNSFEKDEKYFSLSYNEHNRCDGHVLFYFQDKYLQLEQISVFESKKGIGTRLIKSLEYAAVIRGLYHIRSGLSLYNIPSMNLHIKVGYRFVENNQVYHLWNLKH